MLQLPYPADSYQFVSEEIKQCGFRIDGIFKPLNTDQQLPLIFAEIQFQPDQNFYGRFCSEIGLYLYQQKPGRDWLAFVLYPTKATEKPPATEFAYFLSLPQLKRIYLEDYQHVDDPAYALLKLIACPADETVPFVQTLTAEPDKLNKDMLEFIETVLVYKLPDLSREEIRIMLALNDVQLKQTRFYQEVAEECMQEGTLKGETQLLSRQINKRFGPLPPWVQQNLAQADIAQLELWGERILDAQTLADVFLS
jgi:predicted transposase/invertase (TIGR01784 family)